MFLTNKGIDLRIGGASHGDKITMLLTGVPKGVRIDQAKLQRYLDRRKSVPSDYSTPRREPDLIEFDEGLDNDGIASGGDIAAHIKNTNVKSADYAETAFIPRPSHADYPAYVKFGGKADAAGGGKFSGRLTAPLVIAGGIAVQLLEELGISVGAYIAEIGGIKGESYLDRDITQAEIDAVKANAFPVINDRNADKMLDAIKKARADCNSLGGIIESAAFGLPTGLGDALFDGLESRAAAILFGIPAVKGVEFGSGFGIARMTAREANDAYFADNGRVFTRTNHNGGILGGMTTGMPVRVRIAVKPTPSVSQPQQSVDLTKSENTVLTVRGRHDACIVPRAVVAVESALALAILDCIYTSPKETL
ncbi:MAG: chorismate synthase [Clostridiales bacterium]|jgi:chorismate synthase|nr:chorismate synthase [Clostridiales bacterium]